MKKSRFLEVMGIILMLFLNACDSSDIEPEIKTISKDVKDYIYFQEGSWWVYQDSVSKSYDTLKVIEAFEKVDSTRWSNGTLVGIYDWISNTITSSYESYEYEITLHSASKGNLAFKAKTKPNEYLGARSYFFEPLEIGNVKASLCSDDGIVTIANLYNTLTLKAKKYQNCVEFSVSKSCLEKDKPVRYILAKNIGLIEKRINENEEVWQLIDYNIVQ